jgi:hypothetical protein
MVLEDERARKRVWQPVRGPGAVLADGEIVGTWRARTVGSRLNVAVEPLGRLSRKTRERVEEEAQRIAPFRGCDVAEVSFPAGP